jgi:hypothetical protein
MYSLVSIQNILRYNEHSKFIVILRDPVGASISMYKQRFKYVDVKMREVSQCFMDCWNMARQLDNNIGYPHGCRNKFLFRYDLLYRYEFYLPDLIKLLGHKLLILKFNDLVNEPKKIYDSVSKHLSIDLINYQNEIYNKSSVIGSNILKSIIFKCGTKYHSYIPALLKVYFKNYLYKSSSMKLDLSVDEKVYKFFKPTYEYIDTV